MKIKQWFVTGFILVIGLLVSGCGQIAPLFAKSTVTPTILPTLTSTPTPSIPPAIVAGASHTCMLTSAGKVACWGDNQYGQLGDGTTTNRSIPTNVRGLTDKVIAITTNWEHTCALTLVGNVKCWGYNHFGQLGDGTTTDRLIPTDVIGLPKGVKAIAAGTGHTCALTSSGGIKCWGDDQAGAIGDGTYTHTAKAPIDVSGLTSGMSAINGSDGRTCALTTQGGAKCWGDGFFGELGNGTFDWSLTPADVSGLSSGVKSIDGGDYTVCALISTGGVKCWGANTFGALGTGTEDSQNSPVDVSGLTNGVIAIAVGGNHACAVLSTGGVKCWGDNRSGQLGNGRFSFSLDRSTFGETTPADVVGLTGKIISIAAGENHTCVLTSNGEAKCWGNNDRGQLGDGTNIMRLKPVDVVTIH